MDIIENLKQKKLMHKFGYKVKQTKSKLDARILPPRMLPYHRNHSKLYSIIKEPKIERQAYEPIKG